MFNEWYLSRDSISRDVDCFPTQLTGITKYRGCCYYCPTTKHFEGMCIRAKLCKEVFGHCPKEGELLRVTKTRKGWKSVKIDLEFS